MTQLNAESERKTRELEELAYAVSHDLSAPVRAISGYVEVLQEEYASQLGDGAEYVARITRAAKRLDELMAGLVDYSRLARAEVHRVSLDVSQLALEVAGAMPEPVGASVEWNIADEIPARADRQLLRTALGHLLSNAVKFTVGVARPLVSVYASDASSEEVVFAVRDNGIGVDTAQFDAGRGFRLFRRFHPNSQFGGHGVGLACTRVIVENHGGRLWCESVPGGGATFFVALPR
jgi:light-regulated signal transduction histidine kinase (bacteriophytochrome)